MIPPIYTYNVIGCEDLSDPANGNVRVTSTRIGAVATYSCNSGFTLIGKENRVCRPNGEWSGTAPTCTGTIERQHIPLISLNLASHSLCS